MNVSSLDSLRSPSLDKVPPTPRPGISLYATSDDAYDGFSFQRWDTLATHHGGHSSAQASLTSTRTHHPCDLAPTAMGIAPVITLLEVIYDAK